MNASHPTESPFVVSTTRDTFEQDVLQRSRDVPVVVDFWAAWCQPCRMLAPILEKLAAEFNGKFVLVKADTEELPEAAAGFGVQSIPAVFAVRDGQVADYFVGVLPEADIRQWIERLLPSPSELLTREAREVTDPATAEAKLREAIALDAHEAAPKIALAELLLDQDRLDGCRQIIDELEERGFLEPEAEKIKAVLTFRRPGEGEADVDALRNALAQNPDNLGLQLKLANAYALAEQYEDALQIGLNVVQADRTGLGEDARKMMVDVFRLLPDDSPLVRTYRKKLASALY